MERGSGHAGRDGHRGAGIDRRSFFAAGAAGAGALLAASAFPRLAQAGGTTALSVLDDLTAPPFSFTYGGVGSSSLLARWTQSSSTSRAADGSETTTTRWTDAATGLVVRWIATEYPGYPNVSWLVEFENTGRSNSATLADVLAIDLAVSEAGGGTAGADWAIHTGIGSHQSVRDFRPLDVALASRTHRLFSTFGGRPTTFEVEPDTSGSWIPAGWPYFNIEWGTGGAVVAVGWPGQWGMEIDRPDRQALTLRAGMTNKDRAEDGDRIATLELTQLYLAPGESIRTPLIVLQPWTSGGWLAAQNVWRRWMVDFHLPRDQGRPPQPQLSGSPHRFGAPAAEQLEWLDAYADRGQTTLTGGRYDHWWLDAGWYTSATGESWQPVGTWEVSPTRYPNGMAPLADRARELGMSMILWFEPERVRLGTWLADNHPGWLLSGPPGHEGFLRNRDDRLLDFGNADARAWMIRHVNGLLADTGVATTYGDVSGFYREDANFEPLPYWNTTDPSARRGITQAKHVAGHLAYWAAILAANPRLQIDTCASGGRRLDVETLRYAIPLLRSDLIRPPVATQCHNYGLSLWLPVSGNQSPANSDPGNGYVQRSAMTPCFCVPMNPGDPAANWSGLAPLTAEWAAVAPSYLGDYHPLTEYSEAEDRWMGWQFNARDRRSGFLQAFRRPAATSGSQALRLLGLNRAATYRLTTYAATTKSWTASAGFSAVQGANQWRYLGRNVSTGAFVDAVHQNEAWTAPGSTAYVAMSTQQPDASADAVRRWVSPVAGVVRISGRVAKEQTASGGDGVVVSVMHNGTTLWTATIGGADTVGLSTDGELSAVAVAVGDTISFIASIGGDGAYDTVAWDPTITLIEDPLWSASNGFGSTQGANGWRYQARDKRTGVVSDATYRSGAWYAPGGGYVNAVSMHPDDSYDVVRSWTAPSTCTVLISGRVAKLDTGGGDGVVASVLRNGTTIWTRTIGARDAAGFRTDADLDKVVVNAGDTIAFVVASNGGWSYDGTGWAPIITVVKEPRWSATDDFSDTQGRDQWRYRARRKSDGAFSDGSYSAGAWYGPLGTGGGYVAAGSQHPDNSYDAVRTWVAPYAGTVRVGGRVRKQDVRGGNGVVASVLLNTTALWSRTIAFDDASGEATTISAALRSVAVRAGDLIQFVVSNNGEYSYDATLWNPSVTYVTDPAPVVTTTTRTGAQLEDTGFTVTLDPGAAATVTYEQQ